MYTIYYALTEKQCEQKAQLIYVRVNAVGRTNLLRVNLFLASIGNIARHCSARQTEVVGLRIRSIVCTSAEVSMLGRAITRSSSAVNCYAYLPRSHLDRFLQGVSTALLCKPCTSYDRNVRLSVCLSVYLPVRPSVTCWHCVKTTQARITKSSPSDSPRNLVFRIKNSSRNSTGFTPSEGVKWEWGRKNSQFSANNSPYLRNGAS